MAFTAVGSLIDQAAGSFTLTPSSSSGDFILLAVGNFSNSTVFASSVASTNVTWSAVGHRLGANGVGTISMFIGTVTTAGAATLTVTWSGTAPAGILVEGREFHSSLGGWSVDASNFVDSASTAAFPSITPAASGELYWGYSMWLSGAASGGATSGYTYQTDANGNGSCYNLSCTASAQAPTWGGGSQNLLGFAVMVTETAGAAFTPPAMPPAWPRPWQPALARAFGPAKPFAGPPLMNPPIIWQPAVAMSGSGTLSALMPRYIAGLGGSGYNSYFTDQYGTPRLMLLEQAWLLPSNGGKWNSGNWQNDYDTYFATRAAQGYTAWYGIPWNNTHIDSTAQSGGRTNDGIYPLNVNGTPGAIVTGSETITLNNSFWTRIDYLFNSALKQGISCFLNISQSYDISTATGIWHNATNTQGGAFGAALATRYPQSTYPNVFWFFGDDDDGPNDSFYQAILTGMQGAGDARGLISDEQFTNTNCHIEFDNGTAFGGTFGVPNSTYNWVYSYDAPYFGVERSYTEGGTFAHIPPVYGDGIYYGDDSGQSATVQQQAIRHFDWWALASGARGICATSGPSDIGANTVWAWNYSGAQAALTTDPNGAYTTSTVGAIAAFISGLADWHLLIPDTGNAFITAGRGTRGTCDVPGGVFNLRGTNNYVCGSITPGGTLAVIYCRTTYSITIDQTKMGAGYTAMWVDPLTLATTSTATGSTYNSAGQGTNSAGDLDWVLVLQAQAVNATASLSGQGTLSVSGVTLGTSAALSGAGTLSVSGVTLSTTAALSGAGTLTAAPRLEATASLSGAGTLTASPTSSGGATAALSGLGTLTVSGVTIGTTATLSGLGTLTASPQLQATDTLSGLGTLTASPALTGAASLSGAGTLTASPVLQASASLTGSGTLTASPSGAVSATLTGAGTLTAAWTLRVPAALSGLGTLAATPGAAATAALTGSGTLTASPQLQAAAALSGIGTLTSVPVQTLQATAVLAGAGSLSAAWRLSVTGSLSGLGTLATVIQPPFTVGTLTATDVPGGSSGAVLTASDTRTGGPS